MNQETPPSVVDLQLTLACNLRCKMCGQWRSKAGAGSAPGQRAELPLEKWLDLLRQSKAMGAKVFLWGGEPFAFPGIDTLLAEIGALGLTSSLITNGSLLERHAEGVAKAGMDLLYVSVDGPAETHDALRGVAGTFRRIESGVLALRAACESRGRKPPALVVLSVVQKGNQEVLEETVEAVAKLGARRLIFAPLMFVEEEASSAQAKFLKEKLSCEWLSGEYWRPSGIFADSPHAEQFLARLPRRHGSLEVMTSLPPDVTLQDWQQGSVECPGRRCLVPFRKMNVLPDGQCTFCVDFPDFKLGSVNDASLLELWNGARATLFRETLLAYGHLPACSRCLWLRNDFKSSSVEAARF